MLSFAMDGDTRIVEPGGFTIALARSAEDIVWSHHIEVGKDVRILPKRWRMFTSVQLDVF
jgi:hypothetical protein